MIKGKGAQSNPANPFLKNELVQEHWEGIDEHDAEHRPATQWFYETPKNVLSKNTSPDIGFMYSINPYQGCEHGCIYCYARNSHTYWGFSAGLDFESKIVVKKDVARRLDAQLAAKNWQVQPIMLSGNTDCYQPAERQFQLTRQILQVMLKYQHPVSIITKNVLILRDIDLLAELAANRLVHVAVSITSLDEKLRQLLEPRTSTYASKLRVIEQLSSRGIPVIVMNAPIIPSINDHSIPTVLKAAAEAGALGAGYTAVRLNGQIAALFREWIHTHFPDRAERVLHQIEEMHGGKLNDSEWGRRMRGAGQYADLIHQLFQHANSKYFGDKEMPAYNLHAFRRGGNLTLF